MQLQNQRMVLGIILATYLMIVLDATVVITALPNIHEGLNFSTADLSWVQSAYALRADGGTDFLSEGPEGWTISAAGCRPTAPERPYECELEG